MVNGGRLWCNKRRTDDPAMPLRFDSPGQLLDTGLRFDSGPGLSPYQPKPKPNSMTKFKLELKGKKTTDKLTMGTTHITAMTGNANYPVPTRVPTDADVQTAQTDLATAHAAVDAAETVWKQKIQFREQKEAVWDSVITARAGNCESVTPNDLSALASTGFPLRTPAGPVGDLPAPGDLRAKAGDNEGHIDLRCNPVQGARSYEWQCRVRVAVPGA